MAEILVYEEHPCILELYRREFLDEGYDVIATTSLQEAFELFQSGSPVLVLFGIWRPGTEELITIQEMLSTNRRIPIVFTGSFVESVDPGLAALANAHVEQLSDLAVLKKTIQDLCPSCPATRMVPSKPSARVSASRQTSTSRSASPRPAATAHGL